MLMGDCIFCKIVKGEIPSSKIYEDEKVFAFLDLNPGAKGHALIIPKHHAANILELDEGFAEAVFKATRKIGQAQMETLGAEGFNCIQNNFPASGQEVFHIHWHIIPRKDGDGVIKTWEQKKYNSMDEMSSTADLMKNHIGGKGNE